MDYETRATSRKEVRGYAPLFRYMFGLPQTGPINPLLLLDKLQCVYKNVDYEIVDQSELSSNVPARCIPLDFGGFLIEISEKVRWELYIHQIKEVILFRLNRKT